MQRRATTTRIERTTRDGTVPGLGGVPLHFTEVGRGEPAIVCCNGFGVSTFFWDYLVEHFSSTHRVITWDYRGHGRSGSPPNAEPGDFTIRALAEDLLRILKARRVRRAILVGHSMGCQVILEFWRHYRDRVAGLVPICGAYGSPFDTFMKLPRSIGVPVFRYLHFLGTRAPSVLFLGLQWTIRQPALLYGLGRAAGILPPTARYDDMHRYFRHLSEMRARTFWTLAGEMQNHSARPFLREIDVPTLVVAGESDLFSPLELSVHMSESIDGAELLVLPKATHTGLIEQPELINLRLEKFIAERIETRAPAPIARLSSRRRGRQASPELADRSA